MPVTLGAISVGGGLLQTGLGLFGAHKAQKKLEALANQSPTYQPSKAIGDYYTESLNRYMQNPYNTQMYQQAMNNVNRNLGTGIGALQDRRSALAGVSSLVDKSNQALGQAGAQAENRRAQSFAQLGQATTMKAGDDRLAYQYNQLQPWQTKMQLAGAKASGMNQLANAGIGNIFSGLGNISDVMEANKIYGQQRPLGASNQMSGNYGASGSW